VIIHQAKHGPMRVVVEAHGGALALFSPAHRAKVIKRGLRESGMMWLYKWMPLRFTKYAYKLGYYVSNKWKARKLREGGSDMPYVGLTPSGGGPPVPSWNARNGAKMADAVRAGRVTASGKDGAERLNILVPYGHPIQSEKSVPFRTIPANEMEDMAAVLSRRIANEIAGSRLAVKEGVMVAIPRTIRKGGTPRSLGKGRPRKVA
jgi:hypothetical protein